MNLRISQETEGARQGTVERFEDRPQHRNEQKRVQVQMPQVRQSERIRSKQERLGRHEIRRHGAVLNALEDWSSAVAREELRDSECHRLACCGHCSSRMVADDFPMLQTLQIQQDGGSERLKSERQDPRCVMLVRESENGRDVQSFDGCGQR